jgi:hypothetical protein
MSTAISEHYTALTRVAQWDCRKTLNSVNIRLDYDWIDLKTLGLVDATDQSVVETFVLLTRSNFRESRGKIQWF